MLGLIVRQSAVCILAFREKACCEVCSEQPGTDLSQKKGHVHHTESLPFGRAPDPT